MYLRPLVTHARHQGSYDPLAEQFRPRQALPLGSPGTHGRQEDPWFIGLCLPG